MGFIFMYGDGCQANHPSTVDVCDLGCIDRGLFVSDHCLICCLQISTNAECFCQVQFSPPLHRLLPQLQALDQTLPRDQLQAAHPKILVQVLGLDPAQDWGLDLGQDLVQCVRPWAPGLSQVVILPMARVEVVVAVELRNPVINQQMEGSYPVALCQQILQAVEVQVTLKPHPP